MKLIIITSVLFVFYSFKPSSDTSINNSVVYQGVAIDMESQEIIYREVHNEIHNTQGHVVTQTNFFDANENLIAERNLDFSKSKTSPAYSLKDLRTGLKEEVTNKNGIFNITFKENKNSPTLNKLIEVPEPAIVDGGFNYFVKSEWENLMAGNTSHFNFISTARQDYYRFQLSKIESSNSGTQHEIIIKMEPANYILRALLDPIIITYNARTKRIINYTGISNIKDIEGGNHFASLSYPTVGP